MNNITDDGLLQAIKEYNRLQIALVLFNIRSNKNKDKEAADQVLYKKMLDCYNIAKKIVEDNMHSTS